jgi:hypothetical protein
MELSGGRALALVSLLAAAGGARALQARGWDSVVHYRSPCAPLAVAGRAGPALTPRVLLVVVDGLRLDASRTLPTLERLRAGGADLVARVGTPSLSRPGRATIATGARVAVHGVTTNFHEGALPFDSLFRGASRAGVSVAVGGSAIWNGLFGDEIRRDSGAVLDISLPEPPDSFRQMEPRIEEKAREAIRFVLERRPGLGVVDLLMTDAAAHDFGARSEDYRRALFTVDRLLARIVAEIDLAEATLVVTADHGHVDEGGHGGAEPEVLSVPLVLAGRGVRPGTRGEARQEDVAPTLAYLLGLPLPGASQGRILDEALARPATDPTALAAIQMQRQSLGQSCLTPVEAGSNAAPVDIDPALARIAEDRASRSRLERGPIFAVVLVLALAVLGLAAHAAGPRALLAGVAVYFAVFAALVAVFRVRLSLSGIQHEEHVGSYFLWLMAFALLAGISAVAVASRLSPRPATGYAVLGGSVALLALPVAWAIWRNGLAMHAWGWDITTAFLTVVRLAEIQALGVLALFVPLLARLTRPRA